MRLNLIVASLRTHTHTSTLARNDINNIFNNRLSYMKHWFELRSFYDWRRSFFRSFKFLSKGKRFWLLFNTQLKKDFTFFPKEFLKCSKIFVYSFTQKKMDERIDIKDFVFTTQEKKKNSLNYATMMQSKSVFRYAARASHYMEFDSIILIEIQCFQSIEI